MPDLLSRYQSMVAAGQIEADPAQAAAVRRLDALVEAIGHSRLARKSSALGWLFGSKTEATKPPRGLYIWGSVGRGKTMLMDMFFAEVSAQRKRRVHFHDFMADAHGRIHHWRQQAKDGKAQGSEPIAAVAEALASEAWVLCFDEFAVNDIADAMILGRLFTALWEKGVVVVATSNVDPQDLYKDGLNRALFLPFIAEVQRRLDVIKLEARTDFRLEKLAGASVYHTPMDDAAREFHTIILDGVPVMDFAMRNEAKRFITLIDVLYEHHVKLVASAAAEPTGLYASSEGREAFEFERAASRLIEMRSEAYLGAPHGRVAKADFGGAGGLAET